MNMDGEKTRLCPRCGVAMEYRVESENLSNGTRRVVYYYRCPRCGYKMYDAVVVFGKVDGELRIKVAEYRWPEKRVRESVAPRGRGKARRR
jgi:C4-type Zn-finger protein